MFTNHLGKVCSGNRGNRTSAKVMRFRAEYIVARIPYPENACSSKRSILVPWPYFDENNCFHSMILEIDPGLLPRLTGRKVRRFDFHDDPRCVVPIRSGENANIRFQLAVSVITVTCALNSERTPLQAPAFPNPNIHDDSAVHHRLAGTWNLAKIEVVVLVQKEPSLQRHQMPFENDFLDAMGNQDPMRAVQGRSASLGKVLGEQFFCSPDVLFHLRRFEGVEIHSVLYNGKIQSGTKIRHGQW
jgi:hypothetical protein